LENNAMPPGAAGFWFDECPVELLFEQPTAMAAAGRKHAYLPLDSRPMTQPAPEPSNTDGVLLQRPEGSSDEQALAAYRLLLAVNPQHASAHYNIGLILKYRGQWQDAHVHFQRAVALEPDEPTLWNLGIAATALHEWTTARSVWQRLGLPVQAGDTPIDGDYGRAAVQLHPDDAEELVWGQRIDPVRLRVDSHPAAGSRVQHGDVLLHDGAPLGRSTLEGQVLAVFKVLALFERPPATPTQSA